MRLCICVSVYSRVSVYQHVRVCIYVHIFTLQGIKGLPTNTATTRFTSLQQYNSPPRKGTGTSP